MKHSLEGFYFLTYAARENSCFITPPSAVISDVFVKSELGRMVRLPVRNK